MNRVRTVTDATFADVVLGSALPCLVEFRAGGSYDEGVTDWLAQVADANPGLACARLDVSTSPCAAQTYVVETLPAYILFRLGTVVSASAGAAQLPALLATVLDGGPADHRTRRPPV